MTNQKQECKSCGGTNFTKGQLDGYAKLVPLKSLFGIKSSKVIFTFCKNCGEVSSIKVDSPQLFSD